jgi:hypothetical protein
MDSELPRYAPKSAVADLGTQMPISGKPEIGGPGMTEAAGDHALAVERHVSRDASEGLP